MDKIKVIIVDDDPETLDYYRTILRESPYKGLEIVMFEGPEEAKKYLDDEGRKRLNLVISDLSMQGDVLAGFNFGKYLWENFPKVPVVIITGEKSIKKSDLEKYEEYYNELASKPLPAKEFIILVDKCLQ